MKLELFNWFPCHAHSWGVSLVQLLAFFTRWKNRNLKCQRRAADEKLFSNSGGVRLCVTVCAVWAERRERLHVAMYHSQPPPVSEGTSLLPLCLSRFPQLGLEGRAGEECGLFSQRLDMPSSFDSSHSKVHESLLLLKSILDVSISARYQRCGFSFCSPLIPVWPHGSELWPHLAHHCPLPCLGPLFAVFIPVLFPEMGRGSFPIIIMRMILVVNEAVLIARNTQEWVAQQYVCFLRLLSAALVY